MRSIAGCASCSNSSGSKGSKDARSRRSPVASSAAASRERSRRSRACSSSTWAARSPASRAAAGGPRSALPRPVQRSSSRTTRPRRSRSAIALRSCARAVVQVGTPDELWAHPADTDVARFLGLANVRRHRHTARGRHRAAHGAGDAGDGVVESLVRHGPTVRLTVRLDDGSSSTPRSRPSSTGRHRASVSVEIDPAGIVRV